MRDKPRQGKKKKEKKGEGDGGTVHKTGVAVVVLTHPRNDRVSLEKKGKEAARDAVSAPWLQAETSPAWGGHGEEGKKKGGRRSCP